jgi:hypothetical protein
VKHRQIYRRILVAVLVVSAGCAGFALDGSDSGQSSPATPTTVVEETPTASQNSTVSSAPLVRVYPSRDALPVNATNVYRSTRSRLGVSVDTTVNIKLRSRDDMPKFTAGRSDLDLLLGFQPDAEPNRAGAYNRKLWIIMPDEMTDNESRFRRVLVHELVHFFQTEAGWRSSLHYELRFHEKENLVRSDYLKTYWAVVEGSARYVEVRASSMNVSTYVERVNSGYSQIDPYKRLFLSRYLLGVRYVASQVNDSSELVRVHENPPRTMEEIIHLKEPGSEPPARLNLTVNDTETWSQSGMATRRGELYLRATLSTEMDFERAATAAAGWGNDRLSTFEATNETGYVWTIRFDDTANATEFVSAAQNWTTAREAATNESSFRTKRVSNETVALVFGPPEFVQTVTVTGTDSDVRIEFDQES